MPPHSRNRRQQPLACCFEKRWTRSSFEDRLTATAPTTLTGTVALYTVQLGAWLS